MSVKGQDDEREWTLVCENYTWRARATKGVAAEKSSPLVAVVPKSRLDAALVGSEARERELEQERDENFGTIKTICKVLCDLECENGCDEGLEYEGDEWCPCPCIYRHKAREAVLVEARNKALAIAANTNGTDRGMHEALGEIETVLRAGVVEAEPDGEDKC